MLIVIKDKNDKFGFFFGLGFFGEWLLIYIEGNLVFFGVSCFSFVLDYSTG